MPQRTPIWTAIAHSLRSDIAAGVYGPDDKLPTESALAARFGVNRHTVRHAIKALAGEGLVLPRRGAGVFVTSTPTDYPIGRRVRFHQNLSAQGRMPSKEFLTLETRTAPRRKRRTRAGAERTGAGLRGAVLCRRSGDRPVSQRLLCRALPRHAGAS